MPIMYGYKLVIVMLIIGSDDGAVSRFTMEFIVKEF